MCQSTPLHFCRSACTRTHIHTFDTFSLSLQRISNRISQRLAATTAWASYVTALVITGDFVAPAVVGPYTSFQVPNWPHELVGGFLAVLVVFRTNQAYERSVRAFARAWLVVFLAAVVAGHCAAFSLPSSSSSFCIKSGLRMVCFWCVCVYTIFFVGGWEWICAWLGLDVGVGVGGVLVWSWMVWSSACVGVDGCGCGHGWVKICVRACGGSKGYCSVYQSSLFTSS